MKKLLQLVKKLKDICPNYKPELKGWVYDYVQLRKEILEVVSNLDENEFEKSREKDILDIINAIDRTDGNMTLVKEFCHLLLRENIMRSGRWPNKEKTECGLHIKMNEKSFKEFQEKLNEPPKELPKLKKLLSEESIFEKNQKDKLQQISEYISEQIPYRKANGEPSHTAYIVDGIRSILGGEKYKNEEVSLLKTVIEHKEDQIKDLKDKIKNADWRNYLEMGSALSDSEKEILDYYFNKFKNEK